MIDNYCERIDPGLLSEPINAFTNIAFFIAAGACWLLYKKQGNNNIDNIILILLIGTIGTGSILFHTFASNWAEWLDIVPILVFQIFFLWTYIRKIVKLSIPSSFGIMGIFFSLGALSSHYDSILNGSMVYMPALITLLTLGTLHYSTCRDNGRMMIIYACIVFCVSLFFRTIDESMCSNIPIGTHFVWHILNAGVLYFLTAAFILFQEDKSLIVARKVAHQ